MAEFKDIKEAIKFAKVNCLNELVVPPIYIKFLLLNKAEITTGYFNVDGKTVQQKISFNVPEYLIPVVSRLFTHKTTAYSLLLSLSGDLAAKCLSDVFTKFDDNVYILYSGNTIRCMVPEKFVLMPNEYILNGLINKEAESNIVSILMCDKTRVMRMVYTYGDWIKTSVGNMKKAVAILNSEIGMLDYKTVKRASMAAYPAVWYENGECAIINGEGVPFIFTNQIARKRSDILLDFMVDVEMSKLYEHVHDAHNRMLQDRPNEDIVAMLRNGFRHLDSNYFLSLKPSFKNISVQKLYLNILNRCKAYNPQFRVKIEKLCGKLYSIYNEA